LKYLEILGFLNGFNPFFTHFGIFTMVPTPKPTQRKKVVGGEVSVQLYSPGRGGTQGHDPEGVPEPQENTQIQEPPLT
jgi:hypothetical protein